jgi:dTDP-4-dehydrorhamnose reductase
VSAASPLRVVLFGRTGQLATELQRRCPAGWQLQVLGREEADLADPAACAQAVRDGAADLVINAAAYTAVDLAEQDEAMATLVNGAAPAAMAQAAAERGIPMLHVSTDYVFDGSGTRPWRPDDATAPLGAYGRSKLAGEAGVRAAGGVHAILRTSWVFSAHGSNFVKTMLRLGRERDQLNIVADQIGGPTAAADIAAALIFMADAFRHGSTASGTWHFAGAPEVSWAGFAREILQQAGLSTEVAEIATADYSTPARRPANSRLDCTTLETDFGIARPDWRRALTDVLRQLETT